MKNKKRDKKLRWIIKLAKEDWFWSKKAKEKKVDLEKIYTPQDLLKALQKGLYITSDEYNSLPSYSKGNERVCFSSGTSGKSPKILRYNDDDIKRATRQLKRCYSILGIEEGDAILNLFPSDPAPSGVITRETAYRIFNSIKIYYILFFFLRKNLYFCKIELK